MCLQYILWLLILQEHLLKLWVWNDSVCSVNKWDNETNGLNRNFYMNFVSHCLIARFVIYCYLLCLPHYSPHNDKNTTTRGKKNNFHSWQVSTMTCCSKPVIVENKMDAVKKNSKPFAIISTRLKKKSN